MTTPEISSISDSRRRSLVEVAAEVAERAAAGYSRFSVGAALMTSSGAVYAGCNVENASYGLTICAERTAVFKAVAAEGPEIEIISVGIFALAQSGQELITVSPCGACRQVIQEFGPFADVTFLHKRRYDTVKMEDLLPIPFELEV